MIQVMHLFQINTDNIEDLRNAVIGSSSPRRKAIIENLKKKINIVK